MIKSGWQVYLATGAMILAVVMFSVTVAWKWKIHRMQMQEIQKQMEIHKGIQEEYRRIGKIYEELRKHPVPIPNTDR